MSETPFMEILESAVAAVGNHRQIQSLGRESDDMDQVTSEVNTLTKKLRRVSRALGPAREVGIALDVPNEVRRVIHDLETGSRNLGTESSLEKRAEARRQISVSLSRIRGPMSELESELKSGWDEKIRQFREVSGVAELVDVLRSPETDELVEEIKGHLNSLKEMENSLPTPNNVRSLRVIEEEFPRALRTLLGDAPEVGEFIEKSASSEGAQLHQLTPTVQEWLVGKKLTGQFRIVARGSGA